MTKPSVRSPFTCLLAAMLALALSLPARAWAALASSGVDDDDKPSRLVVMRDFNRDGIPDLAEVAGPAGGHPGPASLTLSLGQANGVFGPPVSTLPLGPSPRDLVAGDFNHDGFPDLIVGDDDGALVLFLGDGKGHLVRAPDIAGLDSVVSIAVADFNHDGLPDLAVSDWRASTVTIFLSRGNGSFQRTQSLPLRLAGTSPHLVAADFNGDGLPDLAVVYDDDPNTFDVLLGNGAGAFTASPDLSLIRDRTFYCAP